MREGTKGRFWAEIEVKDDELRKTIKKLNDAIAMINECYFKLQDIGLVLIDSAPAAVTEDAEKAMN